MIIKFLGKLLLETISLCNKVKSFALLAQFKEVGSQCKLEWPLKVYNPEYVTLGTCVSISANGWIYGNDQYRDQKFEPSINIGDYTYIGGDCHIVACNKITIGKVVLIANRCYLSDNLHDYRDVSCSIFENTLLVPGEIQIGDHSWIGENVCIYGNITVGKHCVIGANSVLTKNLPDYSIAVGSPAIIIKRYDFTMQQWRKTDPSGNFIQPDSSHNNEEKLCLDS